MALTLLLSGFIPRGARACSTMGSLSSSSTGPAGQTEARQAMRASANAASKSPNPSWPDESGGVGPEGVPDSHNLYGRLRVKADQDVTAADLARCHLVLIGTAEQNSIVRRISQSLPVSMGAGVISCSDGTSFHGDSLALGLVYYDPLSPRPACVLGGLGGSHRLPSEGPHSVCHVRRAVLCRERLLRDLLVTRVATPTLLASRSFDSRWNWTGGRDSSALLGQRFGSIGRLVR